jgi:glycosyltransferase involved in cell wall biosynthesis
MKISVALATYNGAKFIREQLESVNAQTRPPDELVVVDDGSTDCTLAIIADFAAHARFPVGIHRNEHNLGYTTSFLAAASLCSGDWIAFCDQDDVWLPDKLATVERHVYRRNVMLIAHSAELVSDTLESTGVFHPSFQRSRVRRGWQLPTWWIVEGFALAFRADLLHILVSDEQVRDGGKSFMVREGGHDAAISRLARTLGDIVTLSDCLALHRCHVASVTTTYMRGGARDIRRSRKVASRIRRILSINGAELFAQQSRDSLRQAAIFRRSAQSQEELMMKRKLMRADAHYTAYSRWTAERAGLYQEAETRRRIGRLWHLVRTFGYFRFNGCSMIGMRSCVKDIALDVLVTIFGAQSMHRTIT